MNNKNTSKAKAIKTFGTKDITVVNGENANVFSSRKHKH